MSVNEWFDAVQNQVNLARVSTRDSKDLAKRCFLVFINDEDFVSKTINDSNIDLEKFPARKVRQLAKKLESSKSTARHIKKMSSDPQATQIHLLRHQRTELPPTKAQRKQFKKNKSRPKNMGYSNDEHHLAHYRQNEFNKKKLNPRQILQSEDRCQNVETQNT